MGIKHSSTRSGPSPASLPIGVRRTSYPSGSWVDEYGRPARSPNEVYNREYSQTAKSDEEAIARLAKDGKFKVKGNPDPSNYKVVKAENVGTYLILKINYPDCTNYEGNKILVFENLTPIDLLNQKLIDPHFFEAKEYKSPIARFVPTDRGWSMAVRFAKMMNEQSLTHKGCST